MKILVITPCTAKKKHKPSNQLKPEDFATVALRNRKSEKLEGYKTHAAEMYKGNGHLRVMNGVKNLRDPRHPISQDIIVHVRIISPGYGLLNEEDWIFPYNYTFDGLGKEKILRISQKLGIHRKVNDLLSNYDMVFFLLGKDYVTACELPERPFPNPVTQIFLVAPSLEHTIPDDGRYIRAVPAGEELADQLEGANKYNLKGFVFERLCTLACNQGLKVFEEVKRNPQRIIEMVLEM